MRANYYDWIKIHSVNKHCDGCHGQLWQKGDKIREGGDILDQSSPIIDERPPISLREIAQFQIDLFSAMEEVVCEPKFVGAFSISWKSDLGDFLYHVVRFDMEKVYTGRRRLTEQERFERRRTAQERRGLVDTYFSQIESAYVAHHLGWLNVPPETILHNIPDCLRHSSGMVKLPSDYGTLIMTAAGSFDDNYDKEDGSFGASFDDTADDVVRQHKPYSLQAIKDILRYVKPDIRTFPVE